MHWDGFDFRQAGSPEGDCWPLFHFLAATNNRFPGTADQRLASSCSMYLSSNVVGIVGMLLGNKDKGQVGRTRQLFTDLSTYFGRCALPVRFRR